MTNIKTLGEKYDELVAAGYIVPIYPAPPLEMPTALVYVPTYSSDHTTPYETEPAREAQNAQLGGDPEGNPKHR